MQDPKNNLQSAVFGGGCFWCTEAVFTRLKGVTGVFSGYAGGDNPNPTYEEVSSGTTGHAEVIKIDFNPTEISFNDLLNVFFATHNPTTLNRQGDDVGTQYRSAVFYADEHQKQEAQQFIGDLTKDGVFDDAIVTEVTALKEFFMAEDYHQKYFANHPEKPYCQIVINPKVAKLRQKFSALMKPDEY